jgi:hypothetical protein
MSRVSRPTGALVLVLALALGSSGCSFVFTEGPPPRQERQRNPNFDCSSGYGVPVIDTAISILGLAFLAIGGTTGGLSNGQRVWVGFGSAFVYGVSAVAGYGRVYACREAIEEAERVPELPHHHRPPPTRPLPPAATTPPAPPVPQTDDPADEP